MCNIDEIMNMLDWNNSTDTQRKGLILAQNVQCVNVFLQPCDERYNKNVWENCAKVLSLKRDSELTPYLFQLMEWLQDINWPGAFIIQERLKSFSDDSAFFPAYDECIKRATLLGEHIWLENLRELQK